MTGRTRVAFAAVVATCMGALALLPSYADLGWLPTTIGAVLVVGTVAEGARVAGLPRTLASLLSIAGLAAYVTAVFAHDEATFGFVPNGAAVSALADLARAGAHDISVLRAPVPTSQGLVLLTTLGVAGIALAVDLVAVALRRAAIAGLPLLALFAVSAATVPGGVGWLPFAYAGLGYLVLLLTDSNERVSRWGTPLGRGRRTRNSGDPAALGPPRADSAPLAAVGRRVGLAALGVAVVLPAAIPGLHPGLFGTHGGSGGSGDGGGTITTFNPITRVARQLQSRDHTPLIRYTSTASEPAYLRMTALDRFTGDSWTQGDLTAGTDHRVSKGMPAPFGLRGTVVSEPVTTEAKATRNLSVPWLPVPYPATGVDVSGDWRYDGATRAVFSTKATTSGRSWSVTSLLLRPTRAELEQADTAGPQSVEQDLALDDRTVPPLAGDIARRVTANARTPFDAAVALQDYFQSNLFTYSLDVSDDAGGNAIENFLLDRRGYCVQFASTMALMARILGIPARVAVGFTRGELQPDGSYLVTSDEAHAWPELYFDGIGWVPFEPTPRGDGQARTPAYTAPDVAAGPAPGAPDPGATPTPQPSSSSGPNQDRTQQQAGDPVAGAGAGGGSGGPPPGLLAGLAALVLLLATPATGRWLTRRRRWAAAQTPTAQAHAAWRELGDDARDLGFRWDAADSPRRALDRLLADSGVPDPAALHRLAAAEERARYARPVAPEVTALPTAGDSTVGAGPARDDERDVRRALAARRTRGQRLRARAFPRSTIGTIVGAAGTVLADALDAVDAAIAWVTRTVVPRRLRRG